MWIDVNSLSSCCQRNYIFGVSFWISNCITRGDSQLLVRLDKTRRLRTGRRCSLNCRRVGSKLSISVVGNITMLISYVSIHEVRIGKVHLLLAGTEIVRLDSIVSRELGSQYTGCEASLWSAFQLQDRVKLKPRCVGSLDWFKGKSTGNLQIWWRKNGYPVDFPSNQSIEWGMCLCKHAKWIQYYSSGECRHDSDISLKQGVAHYRSI